MRQLIFLFSLVIAGCSAEHSRNAALLEAERLMAQHPDSAMSLLATINTDSLTTKADSAYYGLLFTEAAHANGIIMGDDSLIARSHAYYETNGDDLLLSRCLLQHGIALYNLQRSHEAIMLLKQAEQLTNNGDDAFRFLLYSVLGDINDNVNNYAATLHYYHMALDVARESGDTERQVRTMNNLTTTFEAMGRTDSAAYYISRCQPLLENTSREVHATAMINEASFLLRLGDCQQAKKLLQQAMQLMPLDKGYMLQANILASEGHEEAAVSMWHIARSSFAPDVRISALRSIIHHYETHSNPTEALARSKELNSYYDELFRQTDAAGIIAAQAQYDRNLQQRETMHTVILLLIVITLLLAVALGVMLYHRRRVARLHKEIDQLNQRYLSWHIDEELLSAPAVNRMHHLADRGQAATSDDWDKLLQLIRQKAPDFMARLNAASKLTPKELNVCLLIRLHFIPSELAVLTDVSPQTITNMRVRLLQKLFHEKGGARLFDTKMQEL